MATYSQWRRNADSGEVRRVTWVCGEQRVLVEEVVDHVRGSLGVSDLDYASMHAGTIPDRDVWAAASQYPMVAGANRLVLVRGADRVRNWEPLPEWLAASRTLPGVHLLFVSGQPDFPYHVDSGKKAGLKPHVEAIKARGHIVRCAMPNEADAIAWVHRRATFDDDTARHLLVRTGGNLHLAAAVCAKVALFDGTPSRTTINQLCAEVPADSFVEHLLLGDKRAALLAAARMHTEEYGKALGLLDTRLDLMAALWKALRSGYPTREVSALPVFLVKQFQPAAKHYDPKRCAYRRRVLAVLEEAHRSGARDALLESLVALW